MGAHVIAALEAAPDLAVGGALDSASHPDLGKEVSPGIELRADLAKATAGCDVAIDFSVPASTLTLIDEARGRGLPLVLATTGFEREEQQRIENAARELAIVQAGNYSLGVTVLLDLVAEAGLRSYDFCALAPVVEGAGGVMTDWQGRKLSLSSDGTVLAAGDAALLDSALETLSVGVAADV